MDEIIMQDILTYLDRNPYPITHVGIGTAPHVNTINDYTLNIQQVLPPFINLDTPTRLIHFDPIFQSEYRDNINFLNQYFNSKQLGFTHDDSEGMHIWRSTDNIIEVIVIPIEIKYTNIYSDSKDSEWFLEKLINIALRYNNKLIVQDYTGRDTSMIFKMLYEKSDNKVEFRNNILFDFTYGENSCYIDLTKHQPIIDKNSNFINIMLMNPEELIPIMHLNPIIKERVHSYYINEYRLIVDNIPVDIRRKVKIDAGDKSLQMQNYRNLYTTETSYEELFNILRKELSPIVLILKEIGIMTPDKEIMLETLISNWKNYTIHSKPDINDWSNNFSKIIQR